MFDWNDEELNNILWDEAGESDDHIVPYRDGSEYYRNKKEWNQENTSNKHTEQKALGGGVDFHGGKLESSSTSGIGHGSWSGLSLSNAPNTEHDSFGTQVSDNLVETTKYCSTSGEASRLDKDSENFQDPNEGKEQGDLVDYSWANIGSFDDLDRIFSNDDLIFGNVNLGNAEELWSSSKDVTNSLAKSFPATDGTSSMGLGALRSTPESSQTKTEYEQQGNRSFTLTHGKIDDPAPYSLQKLESPSDRNRSFLKEQTAAEFGGNSCMSNPVHAAENLGKSELTVDKVIRKKKLLKSRKRSGRVDEANLMHDIYGTWPSGYPLGQYENQMESFAFNSSSSSDMKQQNHLQGTDILQYQQISSPFVPHSAHGNLGTSYPAVKFPSNIQPGDFNQRPSATSYDIFPSKANTINRSMKAAPKLLTMTPQEKIEKLRRRQQMQALIAIQRQQKQFSQQASSSDHSITQKYAKENQVQHVEGTEVDNPCSIPSLDTLSPIEQDDSNTLFAAIADYSLEETTLYRLHDIVSKMDDKIRLSIRDSLFRLAQSAVQRQSSTDTCIPNKGIMDETEDATEVENNNRMSDAETGTNSIDRTVAHLLFHRPQEFSGKHPEMPESPASAKFSGDQKTEGLMDFSMGGMPNSSNNSHQGPQSSGSLDEPLPASQFESSCCIDNSGDASNFGPADGGITEAEASK